MEHISGAATNVSLWSRNHPVIPQFIRFASNFQRSLPRSTKDYKNLPHISRTEDERRMELD